MTSSSSDGPALNTPGAYGYGATPAHIARVQDELARQREQRARRNAARQAGRASE